MENDVHATVAQCASCARNGSQYRRKPPLQLFPSCGPLEFVAMDILRRLPRTKKRNQYAIEMSDSSKLTRAVPTAKTSATQVANIILEHWIVPFDIPSYVLPDHGPQFVSKFFATICGFLDVRHLTTTAYHPQTNGQVERFNKTIVTRLRHYLADHQRSWDICVQPLTHAYNTQVPRSTNTSP